MTTPKADRDLDLVLYGATGFTGKLVAAHLAARTEGSGVRWALAGRTRSKLEAVAADIDRPDMPILLADAGDPATMTAMAARAKVVCTTVGPYALHGAPLVEACVASDTDYCDLTGELHWIRRMIDAHQGQAEETGARIVHTCGFDSIPSDLGTWFAQETLHEQHGVYARRVSMRVAAARGGVSGGTLASMTNLMAEAASDPAVRRLLSDPDALHPDPSRRGTVRSPVPVPSHDDDFDQWTGPFVMEIVNSRVVRRTNALLGDRWGRDFSYDEAVLTGSGPLGAVKAGALAGGTAIGTLALGVGPIRDLASKVMPGSGKGPSPQAQAKGFFDIRVRAEHPSDPSKSVTIQVHGDRDPGYGSTAKMLGESALCLAAGESTVGGGHWTPASAMAEPLLDRLQAHAGVTFSVVG